MSKIDEKHHMVPIGVKKKNSNINEEEYIILKIQENYISGKSDLWEEAK